MKFTSATIAFGLAAVAVAQSATDSAAVPKATLSSQQDCIKSCNGDVNCAAKCMNVPAPTEDMANATTKCYAKCPQGDGTVEQTQIFITCGQKCIADNFYTGSSAAGSDTAASPAPVATGTSAVASSKGAAATGTTGSTGSKTSPSDTAASPSASNAAGTLVASGSVGIVAMIAALFL